MGRMVELAVLESATSGISTLMVDDEKLMRLCVLADEWDDLYRRVYPETAKSDAGLESMLHWFLSLGAEKLQAEISNLRNTLEGQA